MRRSEINAAYRDARQCFETHGWALPPQPRWDITDFGLGRFAEEGLVLVNLAEEPEYAEKLMYARCRQRTPCHTHLKKKEDIICRFGQLQVWLWPDRPVARPPEQIFSVRVNGVNTTIRSGVPITLKAGERITICPGTWHAFAPSSPECIIGEVSTANDDTADNVFNDDDVGRFPRIIEDETPLIRLVSEHVSAPAPRPAA